MNNTKVGSSGTPQVNQPLAPQETNASTSSEQVKTQQSQQESSPPKLSEQNKSQLKNEQHITGAMKQAAIQGEFSKQQGTPKQKNEQSAVDKRPQIVLTAEGKFNLIRPAPQLENLILRGGGAKGIGNPPALIEMEKQGKLDGLKHIVGTSAGALTAMCLASGHSANDLQEVSDNTKMTELLKTPKGFEDRYPTLQFGKIGADGGRAVEIADHTSASKVSNYLQDQWSKPEFKEKLDRLVSSENERSPGAGDKARQRLGFLQTQNFDGNRTNQMITFNDLRLLHQLEPGKFRELTLTGWDEKNNKSTYFNAADYPNMPIAVAGRISMAIPPAFASVKYDPGDGEGERHFADGGIGTNMPSEVVTRSKAGDPESELTGRQRENVLVKTGIMTFDQGGSESPDKLDGAYKQMHGSDKENNLTTGVGNRMRNALVGLLAGNKDIGVVNQKDQQKIAESAANCFVIAHGDLGTFSLTAGDQRVNDAKESARQLIREQLKQRDNQAYAQEFSSINEIFKELTPQDKQALLNGPAPDPAKYAKGATDPVFMAELELYNKVRSS
ncbi:MAG TPA: patatin-like phospholipase family protein [Acidobacteriota bacterium]